MSIHNDPGCESVHAVVTKVLEHYAVTYPKKQCGDLRTDDSVTFSLKFWEGKDEPSCGQVVELIETTLWASGWRAKTARPVTP